MTALTYIIKEVQNINSHREGTKIEVSSLSQAKLIASKSQCFCGTIMRIETESGVLVSYKDRGEWINN